jgi:tetratricopeptide (TPR) repeat protein
VIRGLDHVATGALQHSYDLDVEDEKYLLAAAHLQLGQLLEKQGHLEEALHHISKSLQVFPEYIAALTAMAQVNFRSTSLAPASGTEHALCLG